MGGRGGKRDGLISVAYLEALKLDNAKGKSKIEGSDGERYSLFFEARSSFTAYCTENSDTSRCPIDQP
jgi:hypothetical protein